MNIGDYEPELPWNSPKFREKKDTPWTAGCRWLASWWREQQQQQPGERTDISETLVGAMLPLDAEAEDNFYGPKVITALEDRVIYGEDWGVAPTPVLFRDLLHTQVMVFNLLGEFVPEPDALLPWVRTIDPEAISVPAIRLAWGPDRSTRFDALVEYRTRARDRRFLALVCIYAENLAATKMTVRDKQINATNASERFREGAARRLNRPHLRPLWLATLAAESLPFDTGRVVSLACRANSDALLAANFVRAELTDADSALVASSFDDLVDATAEWNPEWAAWFRTRYLDFTPVLDLLPADDPRRGTVGLLTGVGSDDLRRLVAVGRKVSESPSAFEGVLKRIDDGDTDEAQVAALEARAHDLVADLEAFWQALNSLDT